MSNISSRRIQLFAALIALSLIGNYLLLRSPAMAVHAAYFEAGLLVQVFGLWPALFFALVYPVTRKARQVVLPLTLGVLFGSLALPSSSKYWWVYIDQLRWLAVVVLVLGELWVIVMLLRSLTLLRGSQRPEDDIRAVVDRKLGAGITSRLIAVEFLMWFYALLSWRAKAYTFVGDEFFNVHRAQGNADNQKGFLILIGAEIPLAHGLLWFWSPTGALVITALSAYGFCWLLGDYRATVLRPVSIDARFLHLRYGLLGNERIPLDRIFRFEPWKTPVARQRGVLRHKGGGIPNVRIELRSPTRIETLLGEREYATVFIAVDEPARLIKALSLRTASPDAIAT